MKRTRVMMAAIVFTVGCSGEPAVEVRETGDAAESGSVQTPAPAAAETTPVGVAPPSTGGVALETHEVDATPGLVAELTEATRKDGVLTVKIRFRNAGAESIYHAFETDHGRYGGFYVTAGDQKYFVLKDSEGMPLAPQYLRVDLDPNQSMTWWAKFPAPPADQKTFDLVVPDMVPFEDVPIQDA